MSLCFTCVSTQHVVASYSCCQVSVGEGCKFVSARSHLVKPKQMNLYRIFWLFGKMMHTWYSRDTSNILFIYFLTCVYTHTVFAYNYGCIITWIAYSLGFICIDLLSRERDTNMNMRAFKRTCMICQRKSQFGEFLCIRTRYFCPFTSKVLDSDTIPGWFMAVLYFIYMLMIVFFFEDAGSPKKLRQTDQQSLPPFSC